MRLASTYDRIHAAGAELVAVSVDDDTRQTGMAKRWGLSHTRMVADPGGTDILRPLEVFDPVERGGIALPAMLVIDPAGAEVYRYCGRDFADRTNDDDLFAVLDKLNLPSVDPAPWAPTVAVPDDLTGFFRPKDFGIFFRANMVGAMAIAGRLGADSAAQAIADEHRLMCNATLDAWKTWQSHTT